MIMRFQLETSSFTLKVNNLVVVALIMHKRGHIVNFSVTLLAFNKTLGGAIHVSCSTETL